MKKYENAIKPSINSSKISSNEIHNIINGIETILKNDLNSTIKTKSEHIKIVFEKENQFHEIKNDSINLYNGEPAYDGIVNLLII